MQKEKPFDYLVVGSGLSGSSIARMLTDAGKKVLVIEKRKRTGGNIATKTINDIVVHLYGPHIFHTDDEFAYSFYKSHCDSYPYKNEVLANYEGKLYHMPFNLTTFKELWGVKDALEAKAKIQEETEKEHIDEPKNLEEQALKLVGRTIYNTLISGYTEKQWGRACKDLPASIIKRLPLRFEENNNYFNDKYQAECVGGFSCLIDNLLKGIKVKTGVDYFASRNKFNSLANCVIYTGALDEYFKYNLGLLDYRSLHFNTKELKMSSFQGRAVINFTSKDVPYTRICEHKFFDPNCKNKESTIITYEYPDKFYKGKIPFYPINDEKNTKLATDYLLETKKLEPHVYFLGRLANYKYFDMDDTIIEAKKLFDRIIAK